MVKILLHKRFKAILSSDIEMKMNEIESSPSQKVKQKKHMVAQATAGLFNVFGGRNLVHSKI